MKISKQIWFIIGGSTIILGIIGFLYISNKNKKAALAATQAKLAAEEAKGPVIITKTVTVAAKPTSTSTSSSKPSAIDPSGLATWTPGDTLYARFDNVTISNGSNSLTFNDGDPVGTFVSLETINGTQLVHINNGGKIYYCGVYLLSN
jgi:hypothetical protein